MYHFFVKEENIDKEAHRVYIDGADYNHIRNVLRMHPGEEISVGTGNDDDEYRCEIERFEDAAVICKLMFIKPSGVESPVEMILFQGLPKADKMEFIVQKCVELGVSGIVPVECKRSVVKLDAGKAKARIERWQKIAEAAAKQSKRAVIPEIYDIMSMKEAVTFSQDMEIKMIPYELSEGMEATKEVFENLKKVVRNCSRLPLPENNPEADEEKKTLAQQTKKARVAIFIGPEGGFDEEEVAMANEAGIVPFSLGKRILRTETAGLNVIAWINYCLEVDL